MVTALRAALAAVLLCLAPLRAAEPAPATASVPGAPALSATAQALCPSASALEGARRLEKNRPVEDFAVTTLVSLPFTAFWAFIGATAVLSVSQGKFLPDYSDEAVIGAGATALGASLAIGVVSVSWGKGKAPAAPPVQAPLKR
jgi:hypothetical protein